MTYLFIGFSGTSTPDEQYVKFEAAQVQRDATEVVLLVNACTLDSAALQARQSDFNVFLERGTRITLVYLPGVANPQKGIGTPFYNWLAQKLGGFIATPEPHGVELLAKRRELRNWYAEQSATVRLNFFSEEGIEVLADAVDPNGDSRGTASARWRAGRAEVVAIPHRGSGDLVADIRRLIELLPSAEAQPAYLDDLHIGNEAELLGTLEQLANRRLEAERALESLRALKRILYFREADLEREVVRFLGDELQLPARHVAGNSEDFWLTDAGVDWCIGEVKSGERRNIERVDVNKLDIHRAEAGRDETFPALLVANTMYRLDSIQARDQPPAPNVLSRAAGDHIVLARTLDLFRMKQRALAGSDSGLEELTEMLRTEGGWFEVDASLNITRHAGTT